MTQFKISLHCGQVNTFLLEDFESRDAAINHYQSALANIDGLYRFGDLLVNPKQISFVIAEEVVEQPVAPSETVDVEMV